MRQSRLPKYENLRCGRGGPLQSAAPHAVCAVSIDAFVPSTCSSSVGVRHRHRSAINLGNIIGLTWRTDDYIGISVAIHITDAQRGA